MSTIQATDPTRGVTEVRQLQRHSSPKLSVKALAWRYAFCLLSYPVAYLAKWSQWRDGRGSLIPLVIEVVISVAVLVIIRYRRRWPRTVFAVLLVLSAFSLSPSLFTLWAYGSLATRRRIPEVVVTGAIFVFTAAAFFAAISRTAGGENHDGSWEKQLIEFAIALTVALIIIGPAVIAVGALGFYFGTQRDFVVSLRERADDIEREHDLRIQQGRAAERNRIAREMHDVLAHRLSLVSMHAGVLAFRSDLPREQITETAQVIADNARASLIELQSVVGNLRAKDGFEQPDFADIQELVGELREAGMHIKVDDTTSDVRSLSPLTGRHAYRIVQEALTNARKHAWGADVTLTLSGSPQEGLTVRVSNPLTRSSAMPGAGVGLVGMRERAQVSGGRLSYHYGIEGFVLEVWLPW